MCIRDSDNAHLWFDGFNRLAGFVVSESGDDNFAILTRLGYRFLFYKRGSP